MQTCVQAHTSALPCPLIDCSCCPEASEPSRCVYRGGGGRLVGVTAESGQRRASCSSQLSLLLLLSGALLASTHCPHAHHSQTCVQADHPQLYLITSSFKSLPLTASCRSPAPRQSILSMDLLSAISFLPSSLPHCQVTRLLM